MDALYTRFLAPAIPAALFAVGGYFLIRLRFFFCLHPRRALRKMYGGKQPRQAFTAVCLALGGTMGVGNITGVALALLVGGAGAVFWMLVAAFFAMAVKYAEVVLAMDTRERRADGTFRGGAPYYMRPVGRRHGFLSLLFSLLCIVCSVFQGSILQGNAVGEAVHVAFGAEPGIPGVALSIAALILLLFCRPLLGRVCALLVPLATVLYLFLCLAVLIVHRGALGGACLAVLHGALTPAAGAGGFLGFFTSEALRVGCARGLLSNEAGCGTAPLAHITAEGSTPAGQGLCGVFEVFLDTAVVCTLTALACLTSGVRGSPDAPFSYVADAVGTVFGRAAMPLVTVAVTGFAFATVLSWAFYGLSCLDTLTRSAPVRVAYLVLYCGGLIVGCVSAPKSVFRAIDILLAVMTLINLAALIKKADRVVTLSAEEGLLVSRRRADAPARAPRAESAAQYRP